MRLFLLLLILTGHSNAGTLEEMPLTTGCPNTELGETNLDCPWAEVTRKALAFESAPTALEQYFAQELPDFWNTLWQDGSNASPWSTTLKESWGESLNFDEGAKAEIVSAKILDVLADRFGVARPLAIDPLRTRVHAGLIHTYGYLFSILKTPFGFKRARWVQADIESGFRLPRGSLGPTPETGSLLRNITYFAGRISLQRALSVEPNPVLAQYPYEKLSRIRLTETLDQVPFQVITDFIPFPFQNENQSSKNSHLLLYSFIDLTTGKQRLFTLFPVENSFVQAAIDPAGLGPQKPVRMRYNAWLPIPPNTITLALTGKRTVQLPIKP